MPVGVGGGQKLFALADPPAPSDLRVICGDMTVCRGAHSRARRGKTPLPAPHSLLTRPSSCARRPTAETAAARAGGREGGGGGGRGGGVRDGGARGGGEERGDAGCLRGRQPARRCKSPRAPLGLGERKKSEAGGGPASQTATRGPLSHSHNLKGVSPGRQKEVGTVDGIARYTNHRPHFCPSRGLSRKHDGASIPSFAHPVHTRV